LNYTHEPQLYNNIQTYFKHVSQYYILECILHKRCEYLWTGVGPVVGSCECRNEILFH